MSNHSSECGALHPRGCRSNCGCNCHTAVNRKMHVTVNSTRDSNALGKTTFYNQLPLSKRKEVRERLNEIATLRKRQIELLYATFIEPQKKLQLLNQRVLKSEVPIQHFLQDNASWEQFLQQFTNVIQRGKVKNETKKT